MNKEQTDKKFTDQWWASTQGNNDIRNQAIQEAISKNNAELVEELEHLRFNAEFNSELGDAFNDGINKAIDLIKQKTNEV